MYYRYCCSYILNLSAKTRIAKPKKADLTAAFDRVYRPGGTRADVVAAREAPMCIDSGLTWVAKQCTNVQLSKLQTKVKQNGSTYTMAQIPHRHAELQASMKRK